MVALLIYMQVCAHVCICNWIFTLLQNRAFPEMTDKTNLIMLSLSHLVTPPNLTMSYSSTLWQAQNELCCHIWQALLSNSYSIVSMKVQSWTLFSSFSHCADQINVLTSWVLETIWEKVILNVVLNLQKKRNMSNFYASLNLSTDNLLLTCSFWICEPGTRTQ